MIDLGQQELLLAGVPSQNTIYRLRARLELRDERRDIYLTYGGGIGLRLNGFLVTQRRNIDQLVAYCPIHPDLEVGSATWRLEVHRQLKRAITVARAAEDQAHKLDFIWLGYVAEANREVPVWIYATACVPITHDWNGELLHPRPFCPQLFQHMATQPQASQWLEKRAQQLKGQPRDQISRVSGVDAFATRNRSAAKATANERR